MEGDDLYLELLMNTKVVKALNTFKSKVDTTLLDKSYQIFLQNILQNELIMHNYNEFNEYFKDQLLLIINKFKLVETTKSKIKIKTE
jgi:hypothetical protein